MYPETKRHRMKDEILERIISRYMKTSQPVYYFGWQGGEPTLMGLEFFKKVVEFQKKIRSAWGYCIKRPPDECNSYQ